jgi:hypothetical protein
MSKVLITHREQVRAHFGVGTATRTRACHADTGRCRISVVPALEG